MKFIARVILIVIAAGLMWLLPVSGYTQVEISKFTKAARARSQELPAGETGKFWLFLDAEAFDSTRVALSERSLVRRARVDPDNFLIGPGDYPIKDSVLQAISDSGLKVRHVSRWLRAVSVEADYGGLSKASVLPMVKQVDVMRTFTGIRDETFEPVKASSIALESTALDYGFSSLQNDFIKAVKLHQSGYSGSGVMIAMFDSGFDTSHPVFDSANIIATHDFINGDDAVDEIECPEDISRNHQTSHGTATFSVVGGYAPDTLIGIAYGADFLLAKTEITCYNTEVQQEEDNWIRAAEWADSAGADIINSSLGYGWFTDEGSYSFADLDGNTALITIAADAAAAKNILVFNSAGNERNTSWEHIVLPSDGDSVMAVGAVRADSSLASFSSPGPTADGRIKPDIVTLGVGVVVASHLGGYTQSNGTSYSSPVAAAGAALALETDSTMTAEELRNSIRQTGDRADRPDNDYGWGLFDAAAAADIITFDPPHRVRVDIDRPYTFELTTSGRTDSIPSLAVIDPPPGVTFVDNGDGTATLDVLLTAYNPPPVRLRLTADVGYFVDTTVFNMLEAGEVLIGPNPFEDEVNIYIDNRAGRVSSISIFNIAGEIVWERVNIFDASADEISVLWDGRNQRGQVAAAGVYLLVVKTDRQTYRVKMLKTK